MSNHQKRILAALLALETEHGNRWWDRHVVGSVVGAGGYHQTIQQKSMEALQRGRFILREVDSWPDSIHEFVRCTCAKCFFGLTDKGRELARTMNVRWPDGSVKQLKRAGLHLGN